MCVCVCVLGWGLNILGPEGLLKRGSWSPPRLGLPSLGTHRKSNSPKLLAAPDPGKMEEGEKKKEKCFRLGDELSLWVSRVRGLREPAHRADMGKWGEHGGPPKVTNSSGHRRGNLLGFC